jgi:hypothetical protein
VGSGERGAGELDQRERASFSSGSGSKVSIPKLLHQNCINRCITALDMHDTDDHSIEMDEWLQTTFTATPVPPFRASNPLRLLHRLANSE